MVENYLSLPNGIPSADTISQVLARIDHTKFEERLLSWTRGYFQERVQPGSIIAIDGKTARGSATDEEKVIHLVSAWADEMALVLGQVQPAEKSSEITAIPRLLAALDIADYIVTIDTMSCRKDIAKDSIGKKGDYVLSLKENHLETFKDRSKPIYSYFPVYHLMVFLKV